MNVLSNSDRFTIYFSVSFCAHKTVIWNADGIAGIILNEPVHEKTNNLGFRPGLTQTSLYSHRSMLEASNFGFTKKKDTYYPCSENKGAYELRGYREADLRLYFRPSTMYFVAFLMQWLKV